MTVLTGLKNLLQFLNNNWSALVIIVGLILALWKKVEAYVSLSTDEKIEAAKSQIQEIILKLISDAEEDYSEWVSAGSIKRSQVIEEVFAEYPILAKVADKDELVEWLDDLIDEALVTLREIISDNKQTEENTEN